MDTNTKNDFFRGFISDEKDFSYDSSLYSHDQLFFNKIIFTQDSSIVSIINKQDEPVYLPNIFLTNAEKFLFQLSENQTGQNYLFPDQELFLTFPRKKLHQKDLFLELRNRESQSLDVFCFYSTKKTSRMRVNRYYHNILASPLEKNCAHKVTEMGNNIFERVRYELPIKNTDYRVSQYFSSSKESFQKREGIFSESLYDRIDYPVYIEKPQKTEAFPEKKSEDIQLPNALEKETEKEKEKERKIEIEKKKDYKRLSEALKISKVLPNPKGRDTGNEKIFIKNTSDEPLWLRDGVLQTKKSSKNMANLFFLPFEEKEIFLFSSLPLRNSSEILTLSILEEKAQKKADNIYFPLTHVYWEKAREGEFFGVFAPEYIPEKKNKKNKKNKKSKKSKKSKKNKKITKVVIPSQAINVGGKSKLKQEILAGHPIENQLFKNKNHFLLLKNISLLWTAGLACLMFFFFSFSWGIWMHRVSHLRKMRKK